MAIIYSALKKVIGKSEPVLSFSTEAVPEVIAGNTTSGSYFDVNYDVTEPTEVLDNFLINPDLPLENNSVQITVSNPDRARVENNKVIEVSPGSFDFYINKDGYAKTRGTHTFPSENGANIYDTNSFISGTLGGHIQNQVNAIINGLTPSNSILNYLSANNGDTVSPDVTINPSFYLSAFDFSAVSVISSTQTDDRYPATLVTDRHALIAKHVRGGIGRQFVFRRPNGTYQTVQTQAIYDFADDLSILYFDQAVTGITPFKVMPEGWLSTYAPSTLWVLDGTYAKGKSIIPVIRKSMHYPDRSFGSCVVLNNLSYASLSSSSSNSRVGIVNTGEVPEVWGTEAIGGDSGSPSFLLINGEMIMAYTQHTITSAVEISNRVTEINTEMDNLASAAPGTYVLTHPDLSGFTTF